MIERLYPHLQGGPFYTTVPCGRVGVSKEFNSNEAFVRALKQAENTDRMSIVNKMGSVQSRASLPCVGITKLRTFLETRVEECYRRNVAKIVPLLQSELQNAKDKLQATEVELKGLSVDRLKHFMNSYRERFAKELADTIHGSAKASPEEWGETLKVSSFVVVLSRSRRKLFGRMATCLGIRSRRFQAETLWWSPISSFNP